MDNLETRFDTDGIDDQDIAIIGMSGRFPGARNIHEFWANLKNGVESISSFNDEELVLAGVDEARISDPNYVRAASMLDDVGLFDAAFFGYSRRESEFIDPQCRLFLECAWESLEDAGYNPQGCQGAVGVYASASLSTYLLNNVHSKIEFRDFILSAGNLHAVLGNCGDFLATRVSYKLNLNGPSINVQSACSSSLVAIHLARQSLLNGECDMALAGGSSIYLPQPAGYMYQEGSIFSPNGKCRAFDANAKGTVFGRGVGVVVLKPLADALADGDRIYAVIKGSAVNNDGNAKVGFTAPSVEGQAKVIAEAIANAGIGADTISYVETHGTGTPQGDPIEITGLTKAFRTTTNSDGYCAIGSLKPNIGHLDAASGVASFIKTTLALQHRSLPPSLNFEEPNPEIEFAKSPFFVNTKFKEWNQGTGPRRAGVSSFGMGGTNAHVVLEEAPEIEVEGAQIERPLHVLTLSAKTAEALQDKVVQYERSLLGDTAGTFANFCFTANAGRSDFAHRLAIVASSSKSMAESLSRYRSSQPSAEILTGQVTDQSQPKIAMVFVGQGSQFSGMGRVLFETQPTFRRVMERCEGLLSPYLERSLLSVLYPRTGEAPLLNETVYAQPALFAIEYALAELWRSWGVEPDVVVGHGLGECVAACFAGVFSLDDALKLIARRASLIQQLPRIGRMAVIFAGEERVRSVLSREAGRLAIAALNGPNNVVIEGEDHALNRVLRSLKEEGVESRPLNSSHPFPSQLSGPILEEFNRLADEVSYSSPQIKLVSTRTGLLVEAEQISSASYWCEHSQAPVRFSAAMDVLHREGFEYFLEIGPSTALNSMEQSSMPDSNGAWMPSLRKDQNDWRQLLISLGQLYTRGVNVNWAGFERDYRRRRVSVPTYPFQRENYWIEAAPPTTQTTSPLPADVEAEHPLLGRRLLSALKEIQFESQLSASEPSLIGDHQIFGNVVLPATAYVEMVFAAHMTAFNAEMPMLGNVNFHQALILPAEGSRTVQVILMPDGKGNSEFNIFSRSTGDENQQMIWTLHASGSVCDANGGPDGVWPMDEQVAIHTVQQRCAREFSSNTYYEQLQKLGLYYGPTFQGIRRLWCDDGEALGSIQIGASGSESDVDAYRIHPGFFDACLQVVTAALPATGNRVQSAYLPICLKSVRFFDTIPSRIWSHAVVNRVADANTNTLTADVRVADETGRVVAEVMGIGLRRVEMETFRRAELKRVHDWMYHIEWRRSPTRFHRPAAELPSVRLPNTSDIGIELNQTMPALRLENRLNLYDDLLPQLDILCSELVGSSMEDLGLILQPRQRVSLEHFTKQLGVQARHRRMLSRMCEILVEDGTLRKVDSEWEVIRVPQRSDPKIRCKRLHTQFPECDAELTMLERCGSQLADVLRGRVDPLDLLFPGGSTEALEKLYRDAPFARAYNALVRDTVAMAIKNQPPGSTLRILEIGAGTGGTSSHLLPILKPDQTEYHFTDVSSLFSSKARAKFRDYSFVQYQILDIDQDPISQGFDSHQFDLVISTNALHATSDLRQTMRRVRRLLSHQGLLVIVEGIERQRWVDLIFGVTDGWWKFSDTGLRPSYPLISQSQWQTLLEETGFSGTVAIPGEGQNDLCQQSVILAQASSFQDEAQSERSGNRFGAELSRGVNSWLILSDEGGVGEQLAQLLKEKGDHCYLVFAGDKYEVMHNGRFSVNAERPDDFLRLVGDLGEDQPPLHGVIHLWALDSQTTDDLTTEQLSETQVRSCASVLHLFQALMNSPDVSCGRMYVATRGAQSIVNLEDSVPSVAHAPVWGLGKVIPMENPELRCILVDLAPTPADDAQKLFDEISSADQEDQVAFRGNDRYVARLVRNSEKLLASAESVNSAAPRQLEISSPGNLENLRFTPVTRSKPKADEVQIEVRATGLNFKDVLTALGTYPGEQESLGQECTGLVVATGERVERLRVGDEVMAVGIGSFGSYLNTNAKLAVQKPQNLNFEQAATIPAAFLTAHYALTEIGKMCSSERVLIHAAAGGVGLAAVQLARRAGAEIFATAGSTSKREFLRKLGVQHVMDSRSLNFIEETMTLTQGEGVDVVLNSLAGDFAVGSLSVLSDGGRFLELGKSGALDERAVAKENPTATFHLLDVGADISKNPRRFGKMLEELASDFCTESLKPLPTRVFGHDQIVGAFRYMAQAKHIGKIVIAQPKQAVGAHDASSEIHSNGTYLITGGLGGLGRVFTRWLVEQGARHIVLIGRSVASEEAKDAFRQLEQSGARIVVDQADVTERQQIARVLKTIEQSMPPLKGIIHAAGLLDDGVLLQLNWNRCKTVMGPKVEGAWNLHTLTQDIPLDFFVLFSSAASILGPSGQANHVAACTFLDMLAHHRRAKGLKALSINWGVWDKVGAAVRGNVINRLASQGLGTISPWQGLQAFEDLLRLEGSIESPITQIGVFPITWSQHAQQFSGRRLPPFLSEVILDIDRQAAPLSEDVEVGENIPEKLQKTPPNERKSVLIRFLRGQIRERLGLRSSRPIDPNQPLIELGLDSLIAVELRSILTSKLELSKSLPATLLFDYPTLDTLASYLLDRALAMPFQSDPRVSSQGPEVEATLLNDLRNLSEHDAEALLLDELSNEF